MKKFVVAATAALALAGAATAASATSFVGSYTTSYYGDSYYEDGDNGLQIDVQDVTTPSQYTTALNFNLTAGGSTSVNLFKISTPEGQVDSDDKSPKPFSVTFNFTSPSHASGTVDGDTYGVTLSGDYDEGVLKWDNNGVTTVDFGSNGVLTIDLNDVVFNQGGGRDHDLGDDPATVAATFSLKSAVSAVPEPMTWALMLTGFFGLGAALRANRRQGLALNA